MRQKNHHLGHVLDRRMRVSSFPIQDRGFIAADNFRHVLLQQSQIQSAHANCIAYCLNFFRIRLVLRFCPHQAHTTKEQRNFMGALPFCRATLRGVRCPIGPYLAKVKGYPAKPRTIGETIRKRRLDLGLRQIDVAEIIGCNETTLVNWEKGYTNPRINKMAGVERFLNGSLSIK